MSPGALDVHEVAELLGCSERHVYRLVKERRLPCKRLGRSIRVPKDYLDRWLASELVELPILENDSSRLDFATQAN